jgi:hypothetical protein
MRRFKANRIGVCGLSCAERCIIVRKIALARALAHDGQRDLSVVTAIKLLR